MRALILDSSSEGGLAEMLDRRRRWGADRNDEVWRGVLHLEPVLGAHARFAQALGELLVPRARDAGVIVALGECNFGEPEHAGHLMDGALRLTRVALVFEIVSTGEEARERLQFYAEHRAHEVAIVDPAKRSVDWLALDLGEYPAAYRPVERSRLIALGPAELAARIDWP